LLNTKPTARSRKAPLTLNPSLQNRPSRYPKSSKSPSLCPSLSLSSLFTVQVLHQCVLKILLARASEELAQTTSSFFYKLITFFSCLLFHNFSVQTSASGFLRAIGTMRDRIFRLILVCLRVFFFLLQCPAGMWAFPTINSLILCAGKMR